MKYLLALLVAAAVSSLIWASNATEESQRRRLNDLIRGAPGYDSIIDADRAIGYSDLLDDAHPSSEANERIARAAASLFPEAQRLVFEGDSLTAPRGLAGGNKDWPSQLGVLRRVDCLNKARHGDEARNVLLEYSSELQPLSKGGVLFLWVGSNDIAKGRTAESVHADLTKLWGMAKSDGYKVVAFTIPKRKDLTGFGATIDSAWFKLTN
jgi:hypothetical protein